MVDYLRQEISRELLPLLADARFVRYKPKHFISVSGEVVRNIAFQMSRWGGQSFYVHLYLNTLLNPLGDIKAMQVGRRLERVDGDDTIWEGCTEESAKAAVASVSTALRAGPLSWLVSVCTLKEYVYEYLADPQATADDFELALVFARLGEKNRPFWSADRFLKGESKVRGDDSYLGELRARFGMMKSAVGTGKLIDLTEKWKQEYILKSKLPAAPAN